MTSVASPVTIPVARDIPTTFTASFAQWWCSSASQSSLSEERLFRKIPFFRSASDTAPTAEGVVGRLTTVELSGKGRYLNMFSMSPVDSDSKEVIASPKTPPAVFLPGYGAGIGFFYQNFPALSEWATKRKTNVYALDWLGMGRSARVPFKVHAKREDIKGRVEEAEAFFLDALEEWREKMGIEQMSLVGHSLGAYLSTAYALKYPTRVSRLILLSPAGVPRDPNSTEELSREIDLTPDQSGAVNGEAVPATDARVGAVKAQQQEAKREESTLRKVATYLWEEGWSPFQIVRSAAFYGPWLVGKVPHLLAPGAHARMPLVDRVGALRIPTTFVYGDHDWMDPEGGRASIDALKRAGNFSSKMYIIQGAGHHVYLDNLKATNKLIVKELDQAVDLKSHLYPFIPQKVGMSTVVETTTKEVGGEIKGLADQNVDSVDTNARYAAYAARLRTALRASTRYVAYTSDIGEAFRPVVHPAIVTAAYGVSWAYLAGDVAYETYKARRRGPTPVEAANFSEPTRLTILATQRAVFQSVASMGLPAITIHTIVRQATKAFVNVKNIRLKGASPSSCSRILLTDFVIAWGPTCLGLSVVPLLPYMYDHPVEHATQSTFDWVREQMIKENQRKAKKDL
ncbi:Abhydrolase domain-containing protein [Ceratobasidium theobromae]|uniref:Mitochondrial fission process protein 1 n=1 Tax=Ceratobasidium theobromae TaxID=1582974 RepID=A0A5N5QWM2_9AGAM|nr:Abhydrolase domain-containing protein [Ceratobasidium theobromae]